MERARAAGGKGAGRRTPRTRLADSWPPRSSALMWQLPMVISAEPESDGGAREGRRSERERKGARLGMGHGHARALLKPTHPSAVWGPPATSCPSPVCGAGSTCQRHRGPCREQRKRERERGARGNARGVSGLGGGAGKGARCRRGTHRKRMVQFFWKSPSQERKLREREARRGQGRGVVRRQRWASWQRGATWQGDGQARASRACAQGALTCLPAPR